MTPVDRLLGRLERVRRCGDGWMARCPAHDDPRPSLKIDVNEHSGRILVYCWAGCSFEAVVAAAGLAVSDLFDEPDPASRVLPATEKKFAATDADLDRLRGRVGEALLERLEEVRGWAPDVVRRLGIGFDGDRVVFPYRNAKGALVGLGRYAPNPERRDGAKMVADAGSRRELFPPLEQLVEDCGVVFVVEGEPDAVRVLSVGVAAVGVPGVHGWRPEWAPRFAGRRVVVCFDCDRQGREAAAKVAADLAEVAADVRLLDLDPQTVDGYDLSDFLAPARSSEWRERARRLLLECARLAPRVERDRIVEAGR